MQLLSLGEVEVPEVGGREAAAAAEHMDRSGWLLADPQWLEGLGYRLRACGPLQGTIRASAHVVHPPRRRSADAVSGGGG